MKCKCGYECHDSLMSHIICLLQPKQFAYKYNYNMHTGISSDYVFEIDGKEYTEKQALKIIKLKAFL